MSIITEYYDYNDPKGTFCKECGDRIDEEADGLCEDCFSEEKKYDKKEMSNFLDYWNGYVPDDFFEGKERDFLEKYFNLMEKEWYKYIFDVYDDEKKDC